MGLLLDLGFTKTAQQNLTTDLALKYNKAMQNLGSRYGVSPRTVSYGPTNMPISSGGSTYDKYISAITQQESGGKINAQNRQSGAMGLYQFMPKTLTGLGYKGSFNDFLKNPQLQRQYMDKFTQQNAKQLGINIKTMNLQQAGILAAAHYGGVGGARKLMAGNHGYGNTQFYGKSPYSYVGDITKRMTGRFK